MDKDKKKLPKIPRSAIEDFPESSHPKKEDIHIESFSSIEIEKEIYKTRKSFEWFGLLASVVSLVALGLGLYQFFYLKSDKKILTYNEQIEVLDSIQESIKKLADFVTNQKDSLREAQHTIDSLKSEQEQLKPLVEEDRKTVESIMGAYVKIGKRNLWIDRAWSFGFGVLASLVAMSVGYGIKWIRLKRLGQRQEAIMA